MSTTAAELLAKIKVSGFQEFQSDLKAGGQDIMKFANAAKEGEQLFKNLGKSIDGVGHSAHGLSRLNTGLLALGPLSTIVSGISNAFGSAGEAFLSFGKSAINEAMSIERLTATYAALSGGMDAAAQKMQFLQTFSRTSVNQFDDLAEAGTLLEGSGLRMERFIKSIDLMSGVFGGGKQNVMELSEAIARMASGSMGEAERVFRKFGVTNADFMREGIMSHGGQLTGSVEQLLNAWLNISQRKAGTFGEMIKDGMTLKFSNLEDAWKKLLDRFGEGFFPLLGKMVGKVTDFVSFMNSQDFFGSLGTKFADVFDNLLGVGDGQGIAKFLSYVASGLDRLPGMLQAAGDTAKGLFLSLKDNLVGVYNGIGQGWTTTINGIKSVTQQGIDAFRGMLGGLIDTVRGFGHSLQSFDPFSSMRSSLGKVFESLGKMQSLPGPFGQMGKEWEKVAKEMRTQEGPLSGWGKSLQKFGGDLDPNQLRKPINGNSGDYPDWLFKRNTFNPLKDTDSSSGWDQMMKRMGVASFGGIYTGFQEDSEKRFGEFLEYQKKPQDTVDGSTGGFFNENFTNPALQHLQHIDHATASMAELKKFALGGGDLGQMGVTAAEMAGRPQSQIHISGNDRLFKEWVHSVVGEALLQHQRQMGGVMYTRNQ